MKSSSRQTLKQKFAKAMRERLRHKKAQHRRDDITAAQPKKGMPDHK